MSQPVTGVGIFACPVNPNDILPGVGEKLAPQWFGGGIPLHGPPKAAAVRWGLPLMERDQDAQPSPRLVWARRETRFVKLAPGPGGGGRP
jgi:hypothetical protein